MLVYQNVLIPFFKTSVSNKEYLFDLYITYIQTHKLIISCILIIENWILIAWISNKNFQTSQYQFFILIEFPKPILSIKYK